MEPLVKVPQDSWPQLRDLYKENWPKGAPAYCLLETQIQCPNLNKIFNFEVYCPNGNLVDGMVALTRRSGDLQTFIHPIGNTMKIEEALINTKLIDWNKNIMVPFASPDVVDCLKRLSKHFGSTVYYEDDKALKHLLSRNTTLFEISLPPNTYIGPLRPEHLDLVNKTWNYRSARSVEFFEILMQNDMTYVLYSSDEDNPLAWITANETGALSHLFCLEPHRRKGYAEVITKFACNDLLRKGRDILGYTVENNVKSQSLLDKLGFERLGFDFWTFIKK